MNRKLYFLTIVFTCAAGSIFAQETDTVKHFEKAVIHPDYNAKQEIEIKGKRFRVYNNWLNVGLGEGLNTGLPVAQSVLNIDLHFHFQKQYFQLGTFLSGDRFLSFNNYNLHGCFGKRWEDQSRNISICAGPSYSWGFPFHNGIYGDNLYSRVGLYAEAQYIYKVAYDLGIGLSLFGDWNTRQTVSGVRFELFFSGAYRGEARKKASWMKN